MEKIKSIELGFENCDKCILLPNMFSGLYIEGIKEVIRINCYGYINDGEIIKSKICEDFSIEINEIGLNSKTELSKMILRDRLIDCKDITAVVINYANMRQSIDVIWEKESEYSNKYQTIKNNGNEIIVCISKNLNAEELYSSNNSSIEEKMDERI